MASMDHHRKDRRRSKHRERERHSSRHERGGSGDRRHASLTRSDSNSWSEEQSRSESDDVRSMERDRKRHRRARRRHSTHRKGSSASDRHRRSDRHSSSTRRKSGSHKRSGTYGVPPSGVVAGPNPALYHPMAAAGIRAIPPPLMYPHYVMPLATQPMIGTPMPMMSAHSPTTPTMSTVGGTQSEIQQKRSSHPLRPSQPSRHRHSPRSSRKSGRRKTNSSHPSRHKSSHRTKSSRGKAKSASDFEDGKSEDDLSSESSTQSASSRHILSESNSQEELSMKGTPDIPVRRETTSTRDEDDLSSLTDVHERLEHIALDPSLTRLEKEQAEFEIRTELERKKKSQWKHKLIREVSTAHERMEKWKKKCDTMEASMLEERVKSHKLQQDLDRMKRKMEALTKGQKLSRTYDRYYIPSQAGHVSPALYERRNLNRHKKMDRKHDSDSAKRYKRKSEDRRLKAGSVRSKEEADASPMEGLRDITDGLRVHRHSKHRKRAISHDFDTQAIPPRSPPATVQYPTSVAVKSPHMTEKPASTVVARPAVSPKMLNPGTVPIDARKSKRLE